jgi:hypothetical protein
MPTPAIQPAAQHVARSEERTPFDGHLLAGACGAPRRLTVKAPKSRSSTRSPRARASVIWSNIVVTGGEFRNEF